MVQRLTFLLSLFVSVCSSQNNFSPHLSAPNGSIQLTQQSIEVNVVGLIADVRIYQTFKIQDSNSAQYFFPVDAETSLNDLTIYYANKIFSLEARNMDNIRKQVLAENKKRKKITLSHSENPNFIQLDLPNLIENEEIKVVVKYSQNLKKMGIEKQLSLPSFIDKSYKLSLDGFNFSLKLISPTPIYDSNLNFSDATENIVSKKFRTYNYNGKDWDKNIKLSYTSLGENAAAGMLVYEDKGCRYILGVVEPPEVINPTEIAPREYIFVMDISGSMQGFPIEISKELVSRILNDLRPDEKFNILFFAGSSDFFSNESVYATSENKEQAVQMMNGKSGTGKTKLSEALNKVYKYKPDKGYNRVVVLVTDGKLEESRTIYLDLKKNLHEAQYFCFGIGYDIDRKTIQTLAQTAGTEPVLITEQIEAKNQLDDFYDLIRTPILRNVQVQSKELNLQETYPSQFNGFLSSESTSFVSKECSGQRDPKLILTGVNGDENYSEEFGLPTENNNDDLSILKYLWGREKIDFLLEEEERCGERCIKDGKYRNQIIRIGEELNIATPFTSFIQESYNNNNGERGRKTSLYDDPVNHLTFQNDFDSDFDRFPNTMDECPFDRGTYDRRGCPKSKQEKITAEINRNLEGIEFDFDSFLIKPEFFEKLNTAASIISNQSEQLYIVEGHTDAAGTAEYNMNLSLNRANAVVNYLVKNGVDKKQLTVVGRGDTELLHPECRPQDLCNDQKNFENRRVVFKLNP